MDNSNKYKFAILYFILNCNNDFLGATKLNKLLYYLDFISYRDRGHSVTGESYVNKPYGLVPKDIENQLNRLQSEGCIKIVNKPYESRHKTQFVIKNYGDQEYSDIFEDYEQKLLDAICKQFKEWNTSMIVDQTHLEAPWVYSEDGKIVDYELSKDIDIIPPLSKVA
ncbi:MAG: Panacea domain-containing protein [Candidatus Saccharibacteria bacterium]|nr:Panacea domain-containing protein [Candidatus Saccharibacteria bacterium]